jgi:hypothetical protein
MKTLDWLLRLLRHCTAAKFKAVHSCANTSHCFQHRADSQHDSILSQLSCCGLSCCCCCCLAIQWNQASIENSQFVLQPYTVQGSTKRFNVSGEWTMTILMTIFTDSVFCNVTRE